MGKKLLDGKGCENILKHRLNSGPSLFHSSGAKAQGIWQKNVGFGGTWALLSAAVMIGINLCIGYVPREYQKKWARGPNCAEWPRHTQQRRWRWREREKRTLMAPILDGELKGAHQMPYTRGTSEILFARPSPAASFIYLTGTDLWPPWGLKEK